MNTDTGEILKFQNEQEMKDYMELRPSVKPIDPVFLSAFNRQQLEEAGRTTVSRNSPCPCGSGKRFERCCYTGGQPSIDPKEGEVMATTNDLLRMMSTHHTCGGTIGCVACFSDRDKRIKQLEAHNRQLREAAAALITALDACGPLIANAFQIAEIHGMIPFHIGGPEYGTAKRVLADLLAEGVK